MTVAAAVPSQPSVSESPAVSSVPHKRRRYGWIAIALIAIVAGVAGVYWQDLRDRYFVPRNFSAVEPHRIFRSGQISRQLLREALVTHQIKTIVFMSEDKPGQLDVAAERAIAAELGIERFNFPLGGDGVGNPLRYADAIEVIARCDRAGTPVLVHCHTGAQRTGGAIALYRVLVQGWQGSGAYAELLQNGHDPKENPKLVPFLNEHMKEIAMQLAKRGVIAVPTDLPVLAP